MTGNLGNAEAVERPRTAASSVSPRLLLAILAAAVILNPLLALLHFGREPQPGSPANLASRLGISDLSNYISQTLYLSGILAVAFILSRIPLRRTWWTSDGVRRCLIAFAAAIVAWCLPYAAFNPTFSSISAPMRDEFHEGEILGLAAYLHAAPDIPRPVLAHGPGMDLAPAWAGAILAPSGYRIVAIRLLVRLLGSAAVMALFLALFVIYRERVELLEIPRSVAGVLGYWVIGFCVTATINLSQIGPRRLFLWLQIALMILAARALRYDASSERRQARPRLRIAIFAAVGVAAPVSVFYNYGFGISGAAITVAGLLLSGWRYRVRALPHLLTAVFSALAAAAAILALIGRTSLAAIARDIGYWIRNARAVSFLPATHVETGTTQSLLVVVTFCALVCSAAAAFRRFLRSRANFDEAYALALFLIVVILEFRSWLDRGDLQHLEQIVPTFVLMALYALLPLLAPATAILESVPDRQQGALKWIAIMLFGFMSMQSLDPLLALYSARNIVRPAFLSDTAILKAGETEIVRAMGPDIKAQPCFYALSNSAVWYYLFDRPSCSAFYEPMFARSSAAQRETVSELRRYRPRVVLAVDPGTIRIDGFSPADSSPEVWAYLQQAYIPYKTVGGRDFYRLRDP